MLDYRFEHKPNIIKISKHEDQWHRLAKIFTCLEFIDNETDFVTEAIFSNNLGRADIFANKTAYEIVSSETKKSIDAKKEKYPCQIIELKAVDIVEYWLKKIQDDLKEYKKNRGSNNGKIKK